MRKQKPYQLCMPGLVRLFCRKYGREECFGENRKWEKAYEDYKKKERNTFPNEAEQF